MNTADVISEAKAEFEEVWQELTETWGAGNEYKAKAWQMFYLAWDRCVARRTSDSSSTLEVIQ